MSIDKNFLLKFGWNESLEAALNERAGNGFLPGKIISEERGGYRIQVSENQTWHGELPGKFLHFVDSKLDYPATGDWVLYSVMNQGEALVQEVLPRKSCLYRRAAGERAEEQILACNVDYAFIVTSLNQDLNWNRLERYITLITTGGVEPILVLTKLDLATNADEDIRLAKERLKITTHAVSAFTDTGLAELKNYFAVGKSAVLLGSSGVGKSTLTNYFLGSNLAKTQDIREGDDKGKHTTTSRNLFVLPTGGMLIDTPGMREIQLLDHEEGIEEAFQDIEDLKLRCKFSDCQHKKEPGCAILAGLADGTLDDGRYASYLKLLREAEFEKQKLAKAAEAAAKRKRR